MTLEEFQSKLKQLLAEAVEAGLDPDQVAEIAESMIEQGVWSKLQK